MGGRLGLNLVCGWNQDEFEMFGQEQREHDERYEYGQEWLDVVRTICRLLDEARPRADGKSYADQIGFVADRPGHDMRYAIDASKLKAELGWEPAETFETGIAKTVRWYLYNETWWRNIQAKAYGGQRLGLKAP